MIKGTIQQEDIILDNIYATNIGVPKYVKHIMINIKREINRNIIIVGDFYHPIDFSGYSSKT